MSEIKSVKRALILDPARCGLLEHKRNDWIIDAEIGTEVADLLNPGYWAHVSQQMQPFDQIQVRIDDGSWLINLIVLECARNWARVSLLTKYDFTQVNASELHGEHYSVQYKGPYRKFCIVRKSDNEAIHEGVSTKEAALQWMLNHEKITA